MGITLSLKQVVVLTLLGQVMHVVVLTVVANLFHHITNSSFVFTDQLGVLDLFLLQDFNRAFFFGESKFEIRNTRSYSNISFGIAKKVEIKLGTMELTVNFSANLLGIRGRAVSSRTVLWHLLVQNSHIKNERNTYHKIFRARNNVLGHFTVVLQNIAQLENHIVQVLEIHLVASVHRNIAIHTRHGAAIDLTRGMGQGRRHGRTRDAGIVDVAREHT